MELQDQKPSLRGRGMGEVDVGQVRMGGFIWQRGARFWKRAARKGMWGEVRDNEQWKLCGRWD